MAATRLGLGVTLLALLLAAGTSPAYAQTGSQCSSLKLKAAGAYFKAQARCRAKSVAKGQPSNAMCLVAASDQLARALAKAERRGDCLTLEGDLPVSTSLEDAGDEVSQILAPTCCRLDTTCTWLSEDRCLLQAGTPGAPGTVCSGTGECTPPPAASGECCELDEVLGTAGQSCLAHYSYLSCNALGTYFSDAVCQPNRQCEAP